MAVGRGVAVDLGQHDGAGERGRERHTAPARGPPADARTQLRHRPDGGARSAIGGATFEPSRRDQPRRTGATRDGDGRNVRPAPAKTSRAPGPPRRLQLPARLCRVGRQSGRGARGVGRGRRGPRMLEELLGPGGEEQLRDQQRDRSIASRLGRPDRHVANELAAKDRIARRHPQARPGAGERDLEGTDRRARGGQRTELDLQQTLDLSGVDARAFLRLHVHRRSRRSRGRDGQQRQRPDNPARARPTAPPAGASPARGARRGARPGRRVRPPGRDRPHPQHATPARPQRARRRPADRPARAAALRSNAAAAACQRPRPASTRPRVNSAAAARGSRGCAVRNASSARAASSDWPAARAASARASRSGGAGRAETRAGGAGRLRRGPRRARAAGGSGATSGGFGGAWAGTLSDSPATRSRVRRRSSISTRPRSTLTSTVSAPQRDREDRAADADRHVVGADDELARRVVLDDVPGAARALAQPHARRRSAPRSARCRPASASLAIRRPASAAAYRARARARSGWPRGAPRSPPPRPRPIATNAPAASSVRRRRPCARWRRPSAMRPSSRCSRTSLQAGSSAPRSFGASRSFNHPSRSLRSSRPAASAMRRLAVATEMSHSRATSGSVSPSIACSVHGMRSLAGSRPSAS